MVPTAGLDAFDESLLSLSEIKPRSIRRLARSLASIPTTPCRLLLLIFWPGLKNKKQRRVFVKIKLK
jgi:hypothetical protein